MKVPITRAEACTERDELEILCQLVEGSLSDFTIGVAALETAPLGADACGRHRIGERCERANA